MQILLDLRVILHTVFAHGFAIHILYYTAAATAEEVKKSRQRQAYQFCANSKGAMRSMPVVFNRQCGIIPRYMFFFHCTR